MSIKLKSVPAINLFVVFALVTTPILLEVKQVFAFEKSNPFEDSSVFNGVSDKDKKHLKTTCFMLMPYPGAETVPILEDHQTNPKGLPMFQ